MNGFHFGAAHRIQLASELEAAEQRNAAKLEINKYAIPDMAAHVCSDYS